MGRSGPASIRPVAGPAVGSVNGGRARIVAAMSGGVDSSVAAALLKEQGFDVIGVTMRMKPPSVGPVAAAEDAERVARVLDIPHYVLDVSEVFERHVISYFCGEYALGRTPNPCLACNRFIKFGELLRLAREMGATHVATGHYARTRHDQALGRHLLLRGLDQRKDQSYVLYALDQDQIAAAMFPVGGMRKADVRQAAARFNLPVLDKAESQEICFIESGDYRGFLEDRCPSVAREGPIVDTSGRVLGRHKGLAFYTVGQRKGLGLARGVPLYVVELDYRRNTLVVGCAPETLRSDCVVSDANFIPFSVLTGRMEVTCKIRYKAEEVPAVISPGADSLANRPAANRPGVDTASSRTVLVTFSRPQRAITPGQSAVFYDGEVVVGGGVIQ